MATDVPNGFVPQAQHDRLVRKYNTLHHSYRNLETRYVERKADLERLTEDLTRAKIEVATAQERISQWNLWIKSHPDRIKSDKTPRGEQTSNERAIEDERNHDDHIPSSQTTESEPNDPPTLPQEPPSDDVEVVSARLLKRRRYDAPKAQATKVKQEPDSPDEPIELASEDFSSPVLQRQPPLRAETSDLNALLSNVKTPRKWRRGRRLSGDLARTVTLVNMNSSLSEGDERGLDGEHVPHAPPDADTMLEDRAMHQRDHGSRGRSVLRQLSNNIQSPPRKSVPKTTDSRKRKLDQVAMLTEDGDIAPTQDITPDKPSMRNPATAKRLDELLSGPTPGRVPLAKQKTPETVIRRTEKAPIIKPEPENEYPYPQHQFPRRVDRPGRRDPTPPPPDPEDEPLRSRPLASLQLNDFKVNPRYVDSTFAFADTLRGRDARRCLQGCTKPDCCGNAFRKAVEFGILNPSESDSQLLSHYYGPDYQQIMAPFPQEKQRDLIMQARASAFADQHGKHRQAFERAKSPPGFWRTDMPTTQEEEEDRSRAREMEREKVEERWREALRPGGRWIFRDE